MQGEMIESSRIRKCLWDGPFAMSSQYSSVGTTYTIPGGTAQNQTPAYCIVLNPSAASTVTMYLPNPTPNQLMWCHEVVNVSTFAITLKGANTGNPTIGTIAAGKRAEVIWNPYSSPQEWVALLSA
jgi:hypothetical protein